MFADWRERFSWAPDWAVSLFLIVLAVILAVAAHKVAFRWPKRFAATRGPLARALVERGRGPSRLALIILMVSLAATISPISKTATDLLREVLLVAFIVLVGWAALGALHVAAVIHSGRYNIDVADNLMARKHLTQIKILERTAAIFIVILTLAAALMTLESVRQYGVTLLASAGAAGIIAGLALQPLLTNLIAGVQIAITQPIRLDDAVIVENEWGRIEEIGSTYVVVRLWDWRRMILPLTYFIQKPFQNWTRETASLIGTAMLYVDYSAPIGLMRKKLEEIARASPLWDGDVVSLQVTETSERALQVRCLASARSAPDTFDLRCEVREKMIEWLQQEHPHALPQDRMLLGADTGPGPWVSAGQKKPPAAASASGGITSS